MRCYHGGWRLGVWWYAEGSVVGERLDAAKMMLLLGFDPKYLGKLTLHEVDDVEVVDDGAEAARTGEDR